MQSLTNFATNNWESMIGICVILFAAGIAMAAKMDSKFGYVIAAVGLAGVLFTLKQLNIF